jgi:hypothetical protein
MLQDVELTHPGTSVAVSKPPLQQQRGKGGKGKKTPEAATETPQAPLVVLPMEELMVLNPEVTVQSTALAAGPNLLRMLNTGAAAIECASRGVLGTI